MIPLQRKNAQRMCQCFTRFGLSLEESEVGLGTIIGSKRRKTDNNFGKTLAHAATILNALQVNIRLIAIVM